MCENENSVKEKTRHPSQYKFKISETDIPGDRVQAKKNNAKFLLASTSEVYGDPIVHPQKEDYHGNVNPIGPRSCYVEGKQEQPRENHTHKRKTLETP